MKYKTPRIVQPGGRAIYLWVLLAILLLSSLLIGWWLSGVGFDFASPQVAPDPDRPALLARIQWQEQSISDMETERTKLRAQVAALERAGQIDREATRRIQEELRVFQDERRKSEEELALLKSIVATGVKKEGLYIQGFKLEKAAGAGSYRYRFTVSQALKSAGTATGWIFIHLEGEENGEEKVISLQEITEQKSEKLKMRFRHFQDIDGLIQLPEEITPVSIVIEIKPTNKKLPPIKKRFDWLVAG